MRRAAVLLGALGCGALEPRESVVISATFPHQAAAEQARAVEARVYRLSEDDVSPCPGLIGGQLDPRGDELDLEAEHARALEAQAGARPSSVGFVFDLELGAKAIYGEARDAAGDVTLRGCTTSAVTPGVAVALELVTAR